MNIFKVFASGKKTLGEEQMSAVLSWFCIRIWSMVWGTRS